MIARARVAAFDVLQALSSGRADLPAALARSRDELDDDRDRALVAEIATGAQRWRATLDHLIETVAARSIDRLDPEVVSILRLSAYQLLHLTRVPAAAVVDDAVELARRAKKRSASGFINAVLRSLSRQRHALPLPPRPAAAAVVNAIDVADAANLTHLTQGADRAAVIDYFAITLSHPRWLVSRWYDRLGFDNAERWLQFNNTPARLTLRANRLKFTPAALADRLAREGVRVTPGRYAPDALVVESGQPLKGQGMADGWFVVQDEASQLVALLAGPSPGRRVLDACASPGGKATALAAAMGAMNNDALLVACDVRSKRIALLTRTLAVHRSSGAAAVRVVQADVAQPLPFRGLFDCVLVDAPCSGLGTLRRDPDIKWRRREADLPALASTQRRMLGHAASCVAPGGRLIYATCSSEPEENDAVVDAFLSGNTGFTRVDARTIAGVPAAVVDDQGYLRTAPHVHSLEAFFGAVLERSLKRAAWDGDGNDVHGLPAEAGRRV